MWLTSKLLIYRFRENPPDLIVSHIIIPIKTKKNSGNQEVRSTISNEFISIKSAILLVNTNTIIFYYTKKDEMSATRMHN